MKQADQQVCGYQKFCPSREQVGTTEGGGAKPEAGGDSKRVSKTYDDKVLDRTESCCAVYKCEPSGNQSATPLTQPTEFGSA